MIALPASYDAWRLSSPDDESAEIGTEDGQPCNRFPEPDEDQPRGYRPKRCNGVMVYCDGDKCNVCDACGETA